jgi:biotin carboxyl carrier protein
MTATSEEAILLETRRRIEGNLEHLARLSRSAPEPQAYFEELLRLVVPCINASGGTVWLDAGEKVTVMATLTAGGHDLGIPADVETIVRRCLSENRTLVIAAGESQEGSLPAYFYVPVSIGDRAVAVLQFWLHHPGASGHYADFAAFLGTVAGHASVFLNHRQSSNARALALSWQLQARMHHDLLGCHGTREVLEVAANYVADLAGGELGFACRRDSKGWKLVSASNAAKVVAVSTQALLLAGAVEALPKDAEVVAGIGDEKTPEALRTALSQCGASLLVGSFAASSGGRQPSSFRGALRRGAEQPPPETVAAVTAATRTAVRLFHDKELREALPLTSLLHAAARLRLLWRHHPRRVLSTAAALAVGLAVILFLPWTWRVSADCTVVPERRLSAVAGTDGKLVRVLVGEGDLVKEGQILAKIDDSDLKAQLAAVEQARERWQVEASRAQTASNEADRKVAELNALREGESVKLLQNRLARTAITSPITGIVLTKELRSREGENMETGKVLCEVADPGAYLLELQIRQQDLGEVQHALADGKTLPVDFILHAHASRKLHVEVRGQDSLSPAAEVGPKGSYFILRTSFPGGDLPLRDLKTGYTGKAKLTLGRRPLWSVLFTPFLDYIHVEWGL